MIRLLASELVAIVLAGWSARSFQSDGASLSRAEAGMNARKLHQVILKGNHCVFFICG